jgi:hypothetical protein
MIRYMLLSLVLGSCASPSEPSTVATSLAEKLPVARPTLIDAKNGFRDHHFGDAVGTFSGLELNPHQSTPLKKVYQKRDEQKTIGTTPVLILRYNFYQDKFCGVDLETTMDVLPALVSLYGPASQADSVKQQYWWIGQKATATLQKAPGAAPWLSIWNNQLRAQLEAAEKAATQQQGQAASADL